MGGLLGWRAVGAEGYVGPLPPLPKLLGGPPSSYAYVKSLSTACTGNHWEDYNILFMIDKCLLPFWQGN